MLRTKHLPPRRPPNPPSRANSLQRPPLSHPPSDKPNPWLLRCPRPGALQCSSPLPARRVPRWVHRRDAPLVAAMTSSKGRGGRGLSPGGVAAAIGACARCGASLRGARARPAALAGSAGCCALTFEARDFPRLKRSQNDLRLPQTKKESNDLSFESL